MRVHAPALVRRVTRTVKDVLYGVNAGHAIRHGAPPPPAPADPVAPSPPIQPLPHRPRLLPTGHGEVGHTGHTSNTGISTNTGSNVDTMSTAAFLSYLDGRQVRWRLILDECVEAAGGDPRAQLLAVFDALREWAASPSGGFRSNAFVHAQYELARPASPGRAAVARHKRALRSRMLALAEATGTPDPGLLVDQLLLIYEGAVVNHSLDNVVEPANKAHLTARRLIAAATPQPIDAFWTGRADNGG